MSPGANPERLTYAFARNRYTMQSHTRPTIRTPPAPASRQTGDALLAETSLAPLVLLVDDEEPILETLAMIVEDMGYQATLAANGEEALNSVHAHWPALIITDMMMPRLDGAQFIAALRQDALADGRRLPPIILLTAGMAPRVEQIGATIVLPKPFHIEALEALIRQYLP